MIDYSEWPVQVSPFTNKLVYFLLFPMNHSIISLHPKLFFYLPLPISSYVIYFYQLIVLLSPFTNKLLYYFPLPINYCITCITFYPLHNNSFIKISSFQALTILVSLATSFWKISLILNYIQGVLSITLISKLLR